MSLRGDIGFSRNNLIIISRLLTALPKEHRDDVAYGASVGGKSKSLPRNGINSQYEKYYPQI